MTHTPVLIIGAGPAGLAVAGWLRKLNIAFELLEKHEQVGSAWHHHYDRLHLHTVKEKSHLPFLPFPDDYPRYVPRQLLCEYFDRYAAHFDLRPRFGEEVVSITRGREAWLVRTGSGGEYRSGQVVIATGVNRVPYRPQFPGEEAFQGQILHSRAYRNAVPFQGQRVLVVGMGNTGAEIALDLAENGAQAFLSVRGPVNIVPRDFLGRPTQLTALKLAQLPHWLGDWIGIQVRRLTMGDLPKYGLTFPEMPPARQLREMGKTPVVDIGTADAIRAGKIGLLPALEGFQAEGVRFADGRQLPFDTVILATGYRARVQDFLAGAGALLDQYEVPDCCVASGDFKGLYFVGFDNYTAGGILGVINRDSEIVANAIARVQSSM